MSLTLPFFARAAGQDFLVALIARRLLAGLLMLLAISLLIFAGLNLLPGDTATAILGQSATPAAVHALKLKLGLDQPALARYLHWLGAVLHGDFGMSLTSGENISAPLWTRLKNTLFLASGTALVAVPFALIIGFVSVRFHGSWLDWLLNLLTRSAVALPEFFSGYLLILIFSITLAWLPSNSSVQMDMPLSERLMAIVLPGITLVMAVLGHMSNMTRAALLNAQNSSYIDTAILKGLSPMRVLWRHVLPNAWGPIINVIVLNLAYLMVGVVIVENIFAYPGLGQYMVDSISKRDIPVVQGCALVLAFVYILLNLFADVVAVLTNPRLRNGN
ncbi:ABC transporter permease [Pseudomonas sp. LP_7_YM]|uniref:ABC transporter permease n=1 Tax=Pseudomonas sp. LP_7_YM TaxID=2485137 RepID=UPI00105FFA99|nr:ABC transporter permease [Pseudomonas sp. LP_7_YM]TDV67599.1 peptide/nickel transport system permease protein [Pseudomonas sp. LP_7_YM]